MNIYSTIYRCFNKLTNKSYIGYDSNWPGRKTKHLYDYVNPNSSNYNCHFYRALRRYGLQNFEWEIIYQSWDKKDCLNKMESFFIEEYNSFNKGYNMTKGGEGTLGKQSWLGKNHSQETKTKISLSLKGKPKKPLTEETKRKISESLKRRFLSANLV